jgi:hypothetical protein
MQSMFWLLLLWLLFVWGLWVLACVFQRSVADARAGIPLEHRVGISILPGFPLFPLLAWGLAALGDRFALRHCGNRSIAWCLCSRARRFGA